MLNGPGFKVQTYPKVLNLVVGRAHAKNRPTGRVSSCIMIPDKKTAGSAKEISESDGIQTV